MLTYKSLAKEKETRVQRVQRERQLQTGGQSDGEKQTDQRTAGRKDDRGDTHAYTCTLAPEY